MWIRGGLLGLTVLDLEGSPAGTLVDTYPADGFEPEFAVVRLGRFGEKVLVTLGTARALEAGIQVSYTRSEIEDAPSTECARYEYERISIARAYWTAQGSDRVAARISLT